MLARACKNRNGTRMGNLLELHHIVNQLEPRNKFAVLVYARMKYVRQMAERCKPYVQERRSVARVQFPRAHWVDQRANPH